jgi:predicted DNA-binding protein
MLKNVRTIVMLDKKTREALEAISQSTGAPVAELIRRAINEWLNKTKGRGGKK